jgi:hypothetical protein
MGVVCGQALAPINSFSQNEHDSALLLETTNLRIIQRTLVAHQFALNIWFHMRKNEHEGGTCHQLNVGGDTIIDTVLP